MTRLGAHRESVLGRWVKVFKIERRNAVQIHDQIREEKIRLVGSVVVNQATRDAGEWAKQRHGRERSTASRSGWSCRQTALLLEERPSASRDLPRWLWV